MNDGKRGHHFVGENGEVYLVRCYSCGTENYVLAVSSGQCYACGSKEVPKSPKKEDTGE